ncbi:MAG: carboxylesterase family protein [bacterium]|nr:carboxylesterase family protein [bacterium]
MFFAPVVDGKIIPETPLDAIARGCARDVSLIMGTTKHEMQLHHLGEIFPPEPLAQIPSALARRLPRPRERALEAATNLMPFYSGPELEDEKRFFVAVTNARLFVPSTRLAENQASLDSATYLYRYRWTSPMAEGRLGACHALDISFALGTTDLVSKVAGDGAGRSAFPGPCSPRGWPSHAPVIPRVQRPDLDRDTHWKSDRR